MAVCSYQVDASIWHSGVLRAVDYARSSVKQDPMTDPEQREQRNQNDGRLVHHRAEAPLRS